MATAPPEVRKTAPAHKGFGTQVKDVIDQIVIAFALAFIFRGFIVEAFVIPTGSMAPTLYGQHVLETCSTCGYQYTRGTDSSGPPRAIAITLQCPNCASTVDQATPKEVAKPHSGDRILVHKWPLSVGGPLAPKRWEVTVFKDPHNGTINFIKRLAGLPGEVLEIIQGDLYTAPLELIRKKDPSILVDLEDLRQDVYAHAWGIRRLDRSAADQRYAALNARLAPLLQIQRKAVQAPAAQDSLWFIVYDHDFLPNYGTRAQPQLRVGWSTLLTTVDASASGELDSGTVPQMIRLALREQGTEIGDAASVTTQQAGREWRIGTADSTVLAVREDERIGLHHAAAAEAWKTASREISFASESQQPLSIALTGKPIEDFYAYNFTADPGQFRMPPIPVGDIRLRFTWFPDGGSGGLSATMNRHKDVFTAVLNTDGSGRVEHAKPGIVRPSIVGEFKLDAYQAGKAVEVEFQNVDFRVSLKIDGKELVATTDEQYAPDLKELLERDGENPAQTVPTKVRIGAWNLRCRLRHVRLDRDVYYRSAAIVESGYGEAQLSRRGNPFVHWPGWGTQGRPIMLRDEKAREYFFLGDNSPFSKDSRLWWEYGPHLLHLGNNYQIGTVPDDQLIGQAFFVYWPSGYRWTWLSDIGFIPNFGQLRWIH